MVDKTYVFKLMRAKRLKKLHRRIDAACDAYNHCIALHNRYYGIFGKHLSMYMLQKHLAKILRRSKKRLAALEAEGFEERAPFIRPRDAQSEAVAVATTNKRKEKPKKRRPRRGRLERLRSVVRWETVGSQALQQITERIRNGYRLFFDNVRARKAKLTKRRVSPPTFKSKRKYKSFTRKCNAGKSVGWNLPGGNVVRIDGIDFRFHKSREIEGKLKTITVKRDRLGDVYIYIVCEYDAERVAVGTGAGDAVGFDFGLKNFLVGSDGSKHVSPQFFKQDMNRIRRANRELSRKKKGSKNRERARLHLAREHKRVANRRRDHHFKLARELCAKYSLIALEDLNMNAMKSLWGRKVSDLGFADFVSILGWTAFKLGVETVSVPRFYPSSKTCSACGHILDKLDLRTREWTSLRLRLREASRCPACGARHNRDLNAAINILRVGTSTRTKDDVRPAAYGGPSSFAS